MKKWIGTIVTAIILVAFSACSVQPVPETQPATNPTSTPTTTPVTTPRTEPTTEPTTAFTTVPTTQPVTDPTTGVADLQCDPKLPEVEEGIRRLSDAELAAFSELFCFRAEGENWYNFALTSIYETPKNMNLLDFFYSAPLEELTAADQAFCGESASMIHKYTVSGMNEVLDAYFGIALEDTNGVGLDKMRYNPDGECYYHEHGDLGASYHVFRDGYATADGIVVLYYDSFVLSPGEEVTMMVTLRYEERGEALPCWQIVSNQYPTGK